MEWLKYTSKLKPKDMVPTPWMVAMALQADGWYLRADIVWAKSNPMPESVTDRPTKAHEYVFLLSKQPRYFFDQEAVREDAQWRRWGTQNAGKYADQPSPARAMQSLSKQEILDKFGSVGRNVRSVWEIATQPYPEAHFATFPEALAERCIKAGCPEWVCATCGKPRMRIVEREQSYHHTTTQPSHADSPYVKQDAGGIRNGIYVSTQTLGWSDCGHDNYRTGVVLDPFMGSGTTALVARKHGRHAIGVELNPEYAELCARRLQQLSLLAEEPAA